MTPNNNLNVLAFYDSVIDQNHRKSYAYGNVYPLVCPTDKLLPFVLTRETSVNTITTCNLINLKTGASTDILAAALGNGLAVVVYDQFDLIVNYSNASGLAMAEGQYYLEIGDGENTWFSDVFNVVSDLTNFIKIEYWDLLDFITPDGLIPYGTEYRNWFWVKSEIGKPEYPFAEELEERDGRKYFEKQISEKRFRFEFLAPEFLCDAVRIVRMADNCLIYALGKVYGPEEILFTPEFQEQGDLAVVQVEFETSFVLKKLAGGGYESEGGTVPPELETILGFVRYDAPQFLTDEQKQQARDNIGVGEAGGALPDGIISGFGVQYTNSGFNFNVAFGYVRKDGVAVLVYGVDGLNVAPTGSDPDDPRINVIKVSATDGIQVEEGTPSTPPAKPTDLGEGFFEITFVTIDAAAIDLVADNEEVYTENTPPNWTVSFFGAGTFNAAYAVNPYAGLLSILAQLVQNNSRVDFTIPAGQLNLTGFDSIGLQVYLFGQLNNGHWIQMDLISPSGFTVCGGWFSLPVLKSSHSVWQFVSVDIASLSLTAAVIDRIRIRFYRQSGPTTYPGFQIDNVILQGGVIAPPPTGQQSEDIVFPIVEQGRSKGIRWIGGTDEFAMYVEEVGTTPGGGGNYEKANLIIEFGDNDESVPEIEDKIIFRRRSVDGITLTNMLEIAASGVNSLLALKQAGINVVLPPVASSGSVIYFDKQRTYGSKAAPITFTTLTLSNTGPGGTETPGQFVQVIFHQAASLTISDLYIEEDENSADYDPARVAIIYIEWFEATYRRFIVTYDKP